MKKKIFTLLTLLATVCSGAWATSTVLTPTDGVTTVSTSSSTIAYDADATTWTINQGGVSGGNIGRYAGPYCLVKFDASAIEGTITSATLSFDYASASYNTSYNVYLLGAADWTTSTVTWDSTEDGATALSSSAKACSATMGSGTWSVKSTSGTIEYDVLSTVSKSLMGIAICCNTGREQVISNIKLTIESTTSTVYTATFTETNSLNPTVTIYTDADRTEEIANGALLDATTYYYTATLSGYNDYQGSFTVAAANPSVNFTMTAKTPFTYNVYAVNSSSVKLQDDPIASVSGYEGESSTVKWSKYIQIGEQWYVTSETSFSASVSTTGSQNVVYEEADIAYFFEMENLTRSGGATVTETSSSYSNNSRLRLSKGSLYYTSALAAGIYTISIPWENGNNSSSEVYVYTRSSEGTLSDVLETFTANKGSGTFTTTITVPDGYSIAFNGNEGSYNNNARMDYMVVTQVTVKTMTAAGWATYCSPYALDFSGSIENLTAAYIVTGAEGGVLTLEEIEGTVAANTGILLKGTAGTITIPVVASGSFDVSDNQLVGVTSETSGVAAGIFVLMNESSGVGFYTTTSDFTVGANTAYLPSDFNFDKGAGAREFYLLGETTGIDTLNVERGTLNGEVYNIAGQRVAQPTKGLYIVNGKKVVVK